MIVFRSMLLPAAKQAGMSIPELGKDEVFDPTKFPHFAVFCAVQLNRPVAYHGEHWENAKIIAALSVEEVKKITLKQLIDKGLSYKGRVGWR